MTTDEISNLLKIGIGPPEPFGYAAQDGPSYDVTVIHLYDGARFRARFKRLPSLRDQCAGYIIHAEPSTQPAKLSQTQACFHCGSRDCACRMI